MPRLSRTLAAAARRAGSCAGSCRGRSRARRRTTCSRVRRRGRARAPRAGPVLHARRGRALGRRGRRAAVPAARVLGAARARGRHGSSSCSRTSARARAGWPSCAPATGCGCSARSASASRRRATAAGRCWSAAASGSRRWRSGRTRCRRRRRAARLPRRRRTPRAPRCCADARVATDDGSVGHHGLVTDLLAAELGGDAVRGLRVRAAGDARGGPGAVRASARCPAQLALESGMACGFGACFGCVVPTRDGYVRLCVDGPVLDAADLETVARHEFCGIELAHPIVNASGTFDAIAARRAFGDALLEPLPVRRLRDQDRHARAAPGQPAAAAVGTAGRADQLDRAAEQGPRRLPRRGPAASSPSCRCR